MIKKFSQSNRRERRAAMRGEKRKNNRANTAARHIQQSPNYTAEEIAAGSTSIERARRARSLRNIQHHL